MPPMTDPNPAPQPQPVSDAGEQRQIDAVMRALDAGFDEQQIKRIVRGTVASGA